MVLAISVLLLLSLSTDALPLSCFQKVHPAINDNSRHDANQRRSSFWVGGPNTRGTYDIINAVISTLILCAWSAYHPNVHPNAGRVPRVARRLLWVLYAMLLPELVLFTAWDQWWTAKRLRNAVNEKRQSMLKSKVDTRPVSKIEPAGQPSACLSLSPSNSQNNYPRQFNFANDLARLLDSYLTARTHLELDSPLTAHITSSSGDDHIMKPPLVSHSHQIPLVEPWTKKHGFHAVSGGIAVDSSDFWFRPILTFTPRGIETLITLGLPIDIPEADIEDKSKADLFTKALACIQAIWFFAQCIARLVEHLPLTLLEIHAMIHVACNIAIFCFWISKPYDVGNPTLLHDERIKDLAALFVIDEYAVSLQ